MEFFDQVLKIVRQSGEIIVDGLSGPRRVRHKGRIDLVTETDLAVEAFLKEKLSALAPGVDFMAEESAENIEKPKKDCWIIDPVDGTTNFVHGLPFVATSVALWQNNRVSLGIVNIPALGECFYARRGAGAFKNGAPIHVSEVNDCGQALLATGFPYTIREDMEVILAWLRQALAASQGVRRCGAAAIDLAYVAAGRFDSYYERGLKPWDFSAGWLLVEEAGGRVSDMDGREFSFGPGILASNGLLHDGMVEMLSKTSSSSPVLAPATE